MLFQDGIHRFAPESMRVPATHGTANAGVQVHLDPAATRLGKAARQQATLAVGGAPIAVTAGGGFARQVKGLAHLARGQQGMSPVVLLTQAAGHSGVFEIAQLPFDNAPGLTPPGQPFRGDISRQSQFRELEARLVWILPHK